MHRGPSTKVTLLAVLTSYV